MSADDTPIYEYVEEIVSLAAKVSSSLDVPLWHSCHKLHLKADRLVKKAWSEASLLEEIETYEGGQTFCDSSVLMPLITTLIAWKYSLEGVCVLDLFGGISTHLAAVLQLGIPARKYLYVEKDETARQVFARHVTQLVQRYQKALPSDISLLEAPDLDRVGHIDLVISGWPCHGHTRVDHGAGLQDPRSRMFWKMLRVLGLAEHRHLRSDLVVFIPLVSPLSTGTVETMAGGDNSPLDLPKAGLMDLLHDEYASAAVMSVKKDVHGNYTDSRLFDKYVMPTPKEIFDVMGHAKIFGTLELRAGYHQLPIREEDKAKRAFWGNAPAGFQRVMDRILAGLVFCRSVRCYIDDILVFSDTMEQHQIHLQIVFELLKSHGMRLYPRKCKFLQEYAEYLDHVIYPGGLEVQQANVEDIARIPRSTDVSRGFRAIAKPLNLLLKSDQEWQWGDEQEEALVELKSRLVAATILRRPIRGRPYQLHTDWSMLGLGAMLIQHDDEGKEFVIALYEGECLAAVWVVTHFRCYLFVTNHQPLKWLMESDKLIGKLARWALILQEYDFHVVHRPEVANLDADGMSRNPCTSKENDTGGRWHGEANEEMMLGWHASAFMCLLRGIK
ncbi:hypothetical protein Mp_1g20900 [Marchantia polymorpha subsp. ruderalis]|uniref:Reverse transcriptase domain-containing protein n=2 Tax=Marchantia polymorpha TaxID=3197 RepID=A0AAF6ASG1_MARPO|nr:hypothetical protein MARPO_0001s0425 [Marchantia polymorpha]BBM99381.1 hypothetical protein Mp_1g20900 [Marchantia polymorpha subsp. ruderalis]|eukprot:PTQ50462.1 hypothetical protein MARPO_0001s0425 [Marchantia polymorpha]